MDNYDIENKKISINTFIFPIWILLIIVTVKTIELNTGSSFSDLGVFPGKTQGLPGIFLAPFIHGSTNHLFNNIIPLFFLLSALIHFYDKWAYIIYIIITIINYIIKIIFIS